MLFMLRKKPYSLIGYLQSMEVPASKTSGSCRLRLDATRPSAVKLLPQEARSPERATCSRLLPTTDRPAFFRSARHSEHVFGQ